MTTPETPRITVTRSEFGDRYVSDQDHQAAVQRADEVVAPEATIGDRVAAYRRALARAHPEMDSTHLVRTVETYHRELNLKDPNVMAIVAEGERRKQAKEAADRQRDEDRQAAIDADNLKHVEGLRREARAVWRGTDAEFAAAWPGMKQRLLEKETTQKLDEQRAAMARYVRGIF